MAAELNYAGFKDALVILGAAGIVIPAFTRFRISPIIGFILVGVLVGPSGLGSLVPQVPWLDYITITDRKAIDPVRRVRHHPAAVRDRARTLVQAALDDAHSGVRRWRGRAADLGAAAGDRAHLFGRAGRSIALAWRSPCPRPRSCCRWSHDQPVGRLGARHAAVRRPCDRPDHLRAWAPWRHSRPRPAANGLVETLVLGAITIAIMLVLGRSCCPALRTGGAHQEPGAVPAAACWS
jgi:hypothetical protein